MTFRRMLSGSPGRFSRAVTANTGLPTGDQKMPDAFLAWRTFSRETPEFPVSTIVNAGCVKPLSAEVKAAYDAPFPDETYKEGARIISVPSSGISRRPGRSFQPQGVGSAEGI